MTLLMRGDKYLVRFRAGVEGAAPDFAGCTLKFWWRRADRVGGVEDIEIAAIDLDDPGTVDSHDWHRLADGDWDVQLEATDGEGNIATYPTPQDDGVPLYLRVTIAPDLG